LRAESLRPMCFLPSVLNWQRLNVRRLVAHAILEQDNMSHQ
jgi:hypothetical protein